MKDEWKSNGIPNGVIVLAFPIVLLVIGLGAYLFITLNNPAKPFLPKITEYLALQPIDQPLKPEDCTGNYVAINVNKKEVLVSSPPFSGPGKRAKRTEEATLLIRLTRTTVRPEPPKYVGESHEDCLVEVIHLASKRHVSRTIRLTDPPEGIYSVKKLQAQRGADIDRFLKSILQ